jgi:hypothetical protein
MEGWRRHGQDVVVLWSLGGEEAVDEVRHGWMRLDCALTARGGSGGERRRKRRREKTQ